MFHPVLALVSPEMLGVLVISFVLVLVISLVPYWLILRKAGFSGWWVLLLFIPIVNIAAPWIFALVQWPAMERPAQIN